ncbi:BREX-1 system adenine-specific DNA-methyltransferase PglX [Pseudomonas aeruginosa]|jgi:hypothetical protein|uniref:BREX-1 system adenine-specific DNA-methyltransferase PglX n=1 Tax=Pseudomonas TaxID=286 RepID=UPI0015970BC3|nr:MULTISPECIES: BREX-1 system adenine-specific DNA-methyltransferase PglX [Pseudomonas]MCV3973755.1 BREX-1 system adenine-specific DNA-methyltransferase PglX [Pseudomonas aeruginosa]MDP5408940.1 BREX-1 system adenine-specific DNA-methyltransferase PglX [Pseudomonas aeruginosa]
MSQEQNKDMSQCLYRASAADFMKIPGNPVAYWLTPQFLTNFEKLPRLGRFFSTREGLTTGSNATFLRQWFEVSLSKSSFPGNTKDAARWLAYLKGGEYRRWAGNNEYLIDWENEGERILNFIDPLTKRIRSHNYNGEWALKPGITWSSVSGESFSVRNVYGGYMFDTTGSMGFVSADIDQLEVAAYLNSVVATEYMKVLSPAVRFQPGHALNLPFYKRPTSRVREIAARNIALSQSDWDFFETSWDFTAPPLLNIDARQQALETTYQNLRTHQREMTQEMLRLEEENNCLFIDAYGLQDELTSGVPLEEITLTCNPHYRYGGNKSEEELETMFQCDTMEELVSYAIGCMMGRYSLDKPGLILASQDETLQDYLRQIPTPRFAPDDDAILPLTDQEWFADDATNRFRELIRVVWGDEQLQQNLDFVAESLCLHAIKPKKGEASLDTIRRYLSTQFFKDHLRTYKKRPIYWLFSSGKHKAFECLVYLHRYNDGTLARMRTEYVIPLSAKLSSYAAKLENDIEASNSTAEKKALEKQLSTLHNQQAELATFDEKLRHHADQRISLDLDDGVKVNYGKFGDLLAEVKAVTGGAADD